MKLKHLIIVSLILAIFAIGAVSASEDVAIDDELAVDEGVEIEETPVDESTLGGDSDVGGFNTYYEEIIPVDDDYTDIIEVENDNSPEGNLTISVNNALVYNNEFDSYSSFYLGDLNINTPNEYNVSVNFVPVTGSKLTLADYKLIVTEKENNTLFDYVTISNNVDVSDSEYFVYYSSNDLTGRIIIYIDNVVYYNQTVSDDSEIYVSDLNKKVSLGSHIVQMKYDDGENLTLIRSSLTKFYFSMGIEDFEYGDDLLIIGSEYLLDVFLPKDATGSLFVVLNGKEYNVAYKNGSGNVTIQTQDLDVGKEYKISLVLRNDNTYPETSVSYEITTIPDFDYPYQMSVGEKETVSVQLPSKYSGTLALYKTKWDSYEGEYVKDGNPIATANVVNGKASISLSGLSEGEHELLAEYVSGSYSYSRNFDVDVIKNDGNISASVEPTTIEVGNSVTIKLTGPSTLNQDYSVYIDDIYQDKELNPFKTGSDSMTYKFTTAGQHIIKIIGNGEKFYSNTFQVTVKDKTPTTPVKVVKKATKITAKKATFKAKKKVKKYTITLKAGKALVKKVRVTLKVGKKTYKATTNAKGKATFKINKLTKKGKYQAVIKFAGNKNYKASKKTVSIIVKK